MKNSWLWVVGLGLLALGAVAACLIVSLVVYFLVSEPLTVGPTFTTAEALAYDVVYESVAGAATDIRTVQSQTVADLTAVVVQYEHDGRVTVRHVLTRAEGRQYLVEPSERLAGTAVPGSIMVEVWQHDNRLDSEVLVYGRVEDESIERVALVWSTGYKVETAVVEGTFLFFQSWSPVDGGPKLEQVIGYDKTGAMVLQLDL